MSENTNEKPAKSGQAYHNANLDSIAKWRSDPRYEAHMAAYREWCKTV